MKRYTIYSATMLILAMGVAACDSSIAGPDTTATVEVDSSGSEIAAAKHRKARMGRNPRTGATIHNVASR